MKGSTSIFPVEVSISFSQPVNSFTQTQLEVLLLYLFDMQLENADVTTFTQKTTTSFFVTLTPHSPGEVTVSLSKTIRSTSRASLYNPPVFTFIYKGASLSSPSVLAYSHYAIITVTSTKPSSLYAVHYPKTMAITPTSSVVVATGMRMVLTNTLTYSVNITNLSSKSPYVVFIAGHEEFGPAVATPVSDTRTSFTTVKIGDKPSEGAQCPKGWTVMDGVLHFSQCSGHGVCLDHVCKCYDPYSGEGCDVLEGEDVISANTTHHLIHTALTLTGLTLNKDNDQDRFLQTSIQIGMY